MKRSHYARLLLLVFVGLGWSVVRADDPATPDQLHQMMTDKKFADVVRLASKTLTMGGPNANSVDRYAMLMLKAEAQFQQKQNMAASDTFVTAAKAAQSDNDKFLAQASAELTKRSPGLKYTPAGRGSTPIDVSDFTDRKSAFTALYADMSAAMEPAIKEALSGTTLPPIMRMIKRFGPVRAVEFSATGSDTNTASSIKSLAQHAQDLMSAALRADMDRCQQINTAATTSVTAPGPGGTTYTVQPGLGSRDKNQLHAIINEAVAISQAAEQLADAANDDGLKTAIQSQADQVKSQANSVLTTANGSVNNNNGAPGQQPGGPPAGLPGRR